LLLCIELQCWLVPLSQRQDFRLAGARMADPLVGRAKAAKA
jgi:hypothetical protein